MLTLTKQWLDKIKLNKLFVNRVRVLLAIITKKFTYFSANGRASLSCASAVKGG